MTKKNEINRTEKNRGLIEMEFKEVRLSELGLLRDGGSWRAGLVFFVVFFFICVYTTFAGSC